MGRISAFYRAELAPAVTDQTFARMTERRDGCFGLAAEAEDGTLVGFTHCVLHPTTWSQGGTCYLEDLYVDPDHRGTAAARALIEAAGERAVRRAPRPSTGTPRRSTAGLARCMTPSPS